MQMTIEVDVLFTSKTKLEQFEDAMRVLSFPNHGRYTMENAFYTVAFNYLERKIYGRNIPNS